MHCLLLPASVAQLERRLTQALPERVPQALLHHHAVAVVPYPRDAVFPVSVYLLLRELRHLWLSFICLEWRMESGEMAYPGCYAMVIPSVPSNLISDIFVLEMNHGC
jgi:hypothetical protein